LSINENPFTASDNLQRHISKIETWSGKWKTKINENKSAHIIFTLKKDHCPNITVNNKVIPSSDQIKYLGLTLDKRLTWGPHLKQKRQAANIRLHKLRPPLKSKLSLKTKLLIFKTIIRPI
jgi:hypothetical protein